ncbi:MAG TPA: metallophosphoesterase family protein [Candidatus Angelobacter sp.]|nr:metallophosphoesterase family protein [Candidatus Angelobacter sp.]
MKIGVISDTHDFFDPQIPELFKGVEHIIHAGDVGTASILSELEKIAPVTAVSGNTDLMLPLKPIEVFELGRHKFYLQHIVQPDTPAVLHSERVQREKPDVIVFGHTHKPFNQRIGGIWYFNPGYAGRQRFNLERTLALFHFDRDQIKPEYLKL